MKKGWESYIAYERMMNPSNSKLIKVGSKVDSYIHLACNHLLDMEGRSSCKATKSLVRQIAEIKPDVVHLHNIHDLFLRACLKMAEIFFKSFHISRIVSFFEVIKLKKMYQTDLTETEWKYITKVLNLQESENMIYA